MGFLWMDGWTALLKELLHIICHAYHEAEFWGGSYSDACQTVCQTLIIAVQTH